MGEVYHGFAWKITIISEFYLQMEFDIPVHDQKIEYGNYLKFVFSLSFLN